MDSALHILSGCQCPTICNMVTERHNIASRMILKVISKGSYGSNLLQMDVGSADRLVQHDLHIIDQVSNRVIPPYLFDPSIPDQDRCSSSCPNAILVTPCTTNPNRPRASPSHQALHNWRGNKEVGSSTTPVKQNRGLSTAHWLVTKTTTPIQVKHREDRKAWCPAKRLTATGF
eukprot:1142385-Pelagomonas_calceolata.AAC.4